MWFTNGKNSNSITEEVLRTTEGVIKETGQLVNDTTVQFERSVAPVRESIIKRFPTLFLLAVTFGVTAVATGIEQLLIQHEVLQQHPSAILGIGIGILVLTGRLYKKLG